MHDSGGVKIQEASPVEEEAYKAIVDQKKLALPEDFSVTHPTNIIDQPE